MQITYSNGTITNEEVVRYLKISGKGTAIAASIIKQKEAVKKANELGLKATDEQIQAFADSFRCFHGLFGADATRAYLQTTGWSIDDFEAFCEANVLTDLLKEKLAGEKEIADYFMNHRSEFDSVRISEILVDDENLAREIKLQMEEEDGDFSILAKKYSVSPTRPAGGYAGWVSRGNLAPETAAKAMNSQPDDILGPFQAGKRFLLIRVEEIQKADLKNSMIREAIKNRIFEEWAGQFVKDDININI